MNIVGVKYVPDATAESTVRDRQHGCPVGVDGLLSGLDEYAVEHALQTKERSDSPEDVPVTAVTVGRSRWRRR